MRREQQRDPDQANKLSVKLELQADCYAGVWAKGATGTADAGGQKIFTSITNEDIQQGLDTASKIGDDTLQQRSGGTVNPANSPTARPHNASSGSRPGYAQVTRSPATRSPPARCPEYTTWPAPLAASPRPHWRPRCGPLAPSPSFAVAATPAARTESGTDLGGDHRRICPD
jgi:hypothetical protein